MSASLPALSLVVAAAAPVADVTSGIGATEIVALLFTGLGAGILGGLLGIGGSIIMIPVLTLVFHHDQHVSQAAAMIVNVVVAVAATLGHRRARAVPWATTARMLPAGLLAIVVGVAASNVLPATQLQRIYGVFMLYVIWINVQRLLAARATRKAAENAEASGDGAGAVAANATEVPASWLAASLVAGFTGFAAGLLGIGGGIIAVPMIQRFLHQPLRRAIAASAALMCVTAPLGALRKNLTLGDLPVDPPLDPGEPIRLAAALALTALVGGVIGAGLTHRLPVRWIRAVLIFLLSWAAIRFLGIG